VVHLESLVKAITQTMKTAVHLQITTQVTQSDTAQALAELCAYVRVHSERAAVQADIKSPVRATRSGNAFPSSFRRLRLRAAGPGDNVLRERRLEHALARGRQESSKRLESAY
jgi:hypothetical protein